MFESVTKRRKNPLINIFGWTLLAVCCVVFVFIGFSPNSNFLGQGGAAAEVNGKAISLREYQEMLERLEDSNQGGDREAQRRLRQRVLDIFSHALTDCAGSIKIKLFCDRWTGGPNSARY
jgi:hypothetical protein